MCLPEILTPYAVLYCTVQYMVLKAHGIHLSAIHMVLKYRKHMVYILAPYTVHGAKMFKLFLHVYVERNFVGKNFEVPNPTHPCPFASPWIQNATNYVFFI